MQLVYLPKFFLLFIVVVSVTQKHVSALTSYLYHGELRSQSECTEFLSMMINTLMLQLCVCVCVLDMMGWVWFIKYLQSQGTLSTS